MKKNIFIITICLLFLGFIFVSSTALAGYHDELQHLKASQTKTKTVTDVVMFCQELSSKATNKDWGYKSCLEELSKTIRNRPLETL